VVGTAIGLYLIRRDDPWPERKGQTARHSSNDAECPRQKRTLANSEVREYSWPCVIVLVRKWEDPAAFAANPSTMVPETLYMPDGRAVPVCVVEAGVDESTPVPESHIVPPPSDTLGGGMLVSVESQHIEYTATVGCLVSDGHYTYALTAGHVCGDAGTPVNAWLRGGPVRVGASAGMTLTRQPFSEVYPDFPGRRAFSLVDVGLVRVDDARRWTSNTFGLPPLGPMADFHEKSLSFRLIDQPVVGYGAASGLLTGTIKALFYRFRSVGGFDYVGDYLISPTGKTTTRHGDSGMVWNLDITDHPADGSKKISDRTLLPLAVEWGGQTFDLHGTPTAFAVATSLSSVCRLMGVQLVTDLERDVSGYWGRTGHYSVATFAVQVVKDPTLKAFLTDNLDRLSYSLGEIEDEHFDEQVGDTSKQGRFVPLADVPDEIWKHVPLDKSTDYGREGGRDTSGAQRSSGPEHANHYADIDLAPKGKVSWCDQCLADPTKLEPDIWGTEFYTPAAKKIHAIAPDLAARLNSEEDQGLLPFRVWQLFDAMVACLQGRDLVGFLTAAGVCAHYVGDASQPLHGSWLSDGDPTRQVKRLEPKKQQWINVIFGQGVHSAFETEMVADKARPLIDGIATWLPKRNKGALRHNGKDCALATLQLMHDVAEILPPMTIVESYQAALTAANDSERGHKSQTIMDQMWNDLGVATVKVMVEGAKTLAIIWDSAWKVGKGEDLDSTALGPIDKDLLRKRYIDPDFVPSKQLNQIGPLLLH
jgi:hypothetical protein